MSAESPQFHQPDPFGFSERERLFDRISHERLMTLLKDEQTTIHRVELSSNSYGEFLFVSTSRQAGEQPAYVTFFGLGWHEYRERWLTDEWSWYEAQTFSEALKQNPSREDALRVVEERHTEVKGYAAGAVQSERGKLFDIIADLTDDDGAIAEFEDLDDLLDDLE